MSENAAARRARSIAIGLVGGSVLLRFCYVFLLTDFSHYLVSDMGGYWQRACERLDGDHNGYGQWSVWPPCFHILLSGLFFLFNKLAIPQGLWLACVLGLQILLGSFSVYWVYRIAYVVARRERPALALAVIYGLTYPVVYFNAFLLSENLAIPLVIGATFLLFQHANRRFAMLSAGALLGLAAGVRPADILYAAPFLLYLATALRFSSGNIAGNPTRKWRRWTPLLMFAAGFVAVVGLLCLENARISSGAVTGLGANGGMNFFMAQCKIGRLDSHTTYNGQFYSYSFSHPQFAGESWRTTFTTTVGLHEQNYFYKLGLHQLKSLSTWREDLWELRKLLIGPIFPTFYNAWGFETLDLFFRWALAGTFLIAAAAPPAGWILRRSWASREILLLWSTNALTFAACFFYGDERRFLYPGVFAAEIVVFALAYPVGISMITRLRRPQAGNIESITPSLP